jgi:hypothetical protein
MERDRSRPETGTKDKQRERQRTAATQAKSLSLAGKQGAKVPFNNGIETRPPAIGFLSEQNI